MGSKLLINEHPLQVLPGLAKAIGLNEAILLQQIHYWTVDSQKIHDGKKWTYNSATEWKKQFPFWSESTIRRAVNSLRKQQLIYTTSEYNKMPMDKTLWFSINYDSLNRLTIPSSQNDHTIQSDCIDEVVKMDRAIPENSTKTSTEKQTKRQQVDYEIDFKEFYNLYPKKVDPSAARKAYAKQRKMKVTHEQIMYGIKRFNEEIKLTGMDRQYIKNPSTWLNAGSYMNYEEASVSSSQAAANSLPAYEPDHIEEATFKWSKN